MKGLRLLVILTLLGAPAIVGLLFTYEIIKVDWISMMEDQPSFRPMEDPLPIPAESVPFMADYVQYVPPVNPVPADEVSLERGKVLYDIHCAVCHGPQGKGDGYMAQFDMQPADLTASALDDAGMFLFVTNGTPNMPPMRESLTVRDRWDVINYVRHVLQGQK
ncbi:MAG: cytochrome c [Chloroflexi bacterium]|nr:cytochrome c [Chloroflexota bacterium]